MYTALYRAQRPEIFEEILGQEHIVKVLKYQLASNTVSHAYLFCGTRGTGKTTTARILAKGVNCTHEDAAGRPCGECASCRAIAAGSFMDVIEIDAASNNGVENIRELRESVKYPPALGRKKVYIIDEVHMLSTGAFNALLKTLEEPPENVMFILATTEPQKLPATILSRCMRLDFKRVPQNLLMAGMGRICSEKGVEITDSALRLLANCADGSVRDGLSILDQVLAAGEKHIDREQVLEYIGAAGEEFFIQLTDLVSLHHVGEALALLDRVLSDGKDAKQLMKDWTAHYRNLMITKFIKNPEDMLNMATENVQRIADQSQQITLEEIDHAILRLSAAINDARWSTQPRILLELAMVAIATGLQDPGSTYAPRKVQASPAPQTFVPASAPAPKPQMQQPAVSAQPQAPAAAPVKQPVCAEPQQPAQSSAELDNLWHRVFEAGEDEEGSFNLIRTGTSLVHLGEKDFTIATKSAFAKRFAEQKRDQLENILERIVGKRLRMNVIEEKDWHMQAGVSPAGGKGAAPDVSEDDEMARLVAQAEEMLGIDIELE